MSAAQPKASEPSMEEILASIRRIISDEPHKTAAPVAAPAPLAAVPGPQPPLAEEAPEDDEVLELTPKARVKIPEPHYITDDPVANDLSFEDAKPPAPKSQGDIDALMSFDPPKPQSLPEAPVLPAVVATIAPSAAAVTEPRLISLEADRAASGAFSSLATTILSKNARTLEDLMQEMMRPLIKTWLDDNLPTVVERLVKAEIERVSRGGR
jgi:uncharacterized protein